MAEAGGGGGGGGGGDDGRMLSRDRPLTFDALLAGGFIELPLPATAGGAAATPAAPELPLPTTAGGAAATPAALASHPRVLYGRLIANTPDNWAVFDPRRAFAFAPWAPVKARSFVTDEEGVRELTALRGDAAAALLHVGWSSQDVASYRDRVVKLVVFEALAPRAPHATWDHVFNDVLPAIAATGAAVAAPPWDADVAVNRRFATVLRQNRALVEAVDNATPRVTPNYPDARIADFLAGLAAGEPDWLFARRLLDQLLYLGDLFDGSGRTRLHDGSTQGVAEYLVESHAADDARVAVLEFAWR
jgi:hypothetical protein